ncbi:MAG: LicD family protein [Lachnospiraceae bacterium]|nr:LicD family protein [Lachnospiraceae bacterium]
MDITTEFLRDEVRSGFYIPTAIKQAWAVQLHILSEIDRICRKYNITYFADWGTLLGTIRHGGYVPWDDDLDICMKREDYNRFRQVADRELPKEFAIHDYERKDGHWLFLARVINRNQICFDKEHLDKYYNFPYIATVDIFVLDYLYKDEEQEQKRCEEVKYLLALADLIVQGNKTFSDMSLELGKVESMYHTTINPTLSSRDIGIRLYQIAEQQMARVPKEEADTIGQIFPWVLKGGRGLPKKYYEKTVRLPFEMTTMPVPAYYHLVLQNRYGDYFKVHKVWDGHDYPYFEGQRRNLQKEADFELPEFKFNKSMLRQRDAESDKSGSLKIISEECVAELDMMLTSVEGGVEGKLYDEVLAILPECQQLAIDLGTLIESVKGENNLCSAIVVSSLEQFCEALFGVYEILTAEADIKGDLLSKQLVNLRETFSVVVQEVSSQIIEKKEILFVTTGHKQWRGFESLYAAASAEAENDIYVVPVPLLWKNGYGQVTMTDDEIIAAVKSEAYPEYVKLTAWSSYSLELHHPDIIFIQDPYDGENGCLTIPSQFYAKNLQKYTEKLIYVPPYVVEEFGQRDTTALYNMKHYVTAPGVVCADNVIVQSEHMRKLYVDKLTEFAGGDTKAIWEEKLLALGLPVMDVEYADKKDSQDKRILFCLGCNDLSESEVDFVSKLQDKLAVFKANHDKLQVGICMYPADIEQWNMVDEENVVSRVVEAIKELSIEPWCFIVDVSQMDMIDIARDFDAYYGCSSPLVHMFNCEQKPVMLW